VLVAGASFEHSVPNWLRCRFGTAVTIATFKTATEVYCITPPQDLGDYPVEVSNNNQDYTTVRDR
jgi:hypothetical protein